MSPVRICTTHIVFEYSHEIVFRLTTSTSFIKLARHLSVFWNSTHAKAQPRYSGNLLLSLTSSVPFLRALVCKFYPMISIWFRHRRRVLLQGSTTKLVDVIRVYLFEQQDPALASGKMVGYYRSILGGVADVASWDVGYVDESVYDLSVELSLNL